MRKGSKASTKLAVYSSAVILAAMSVPMARATVTVDGLRDADYGSPLATQTVNTQFGDNTAADGNTANGSELDAAYGVVQAGTGKLNLFFAGNSETNFNHLNIFIDDGRSGGQSTLSAQGSLASMSGSKFSTGFSATYALDVNGGGAGTNPPTWFANSNNLRSAGGPSSFLGQYTPPSTTAQHDTGQFGTSGVFIGVDNSNILGVVGGTTAADTNAANAVTTGVEISIPLSLLGNPHGSIRILADINGGGNGFLSNQFLPGLPAGTGNVGNGGKFDFSATNNMFFSVAIPPGNNTNGSWLPSVGGSWTTPASWTGSLIPNFAGDSAAFASATTASTVTLDGNKTVGQITLNSVNSYTIAQGTGGTLTIDDTGDSGGVDPSIDVAAGSHTISAPLSLSATTGISATDNTALTISGNISGSGGITKDGAGKLALGGNNTFGGPITVLNGTVELDSATAASDTPINIGDGSTDLVPATLAIGVSGLTIGNPITTNKDLSATNTFRIISGTYTSGSATVSSTIDVNGGVDFFLPNAGTTLTVSGVIEAGADTHGSARHSIHVSGLGTVILTNANTTTGDTVIDGGTLELRNNNAATNTIFIGDGGTTNVPATLNIGLSGLTIANTIQTNIDAGGASNIRTIAGTYATGSSNISGPINVNGGLNLAATNAAATLTVDGAIADGTDASGTASHALNVGGLGTVVLTNASTYSGNTSVNSGTLTISSTGSIASPNVTVASGATMNVDGSLAPTAFVYANGSTNFAGNHGAGATLPLPLGSLTVDSGAIAKVKASDFAFRPVVLQAAVLVFGGDTSKIDLTNNELVTPGSAASILPFIQGGRIFSSLLPNATKALGYIDLSGADAGKVEVRYTLKGDTNLDGSVDVGDLGALATAYGISGGQSWANGDFNQDSNVDVGDLGALATNYGTQLANGPSADAAQTLAVVAGASGTSVPEPASVGAIGLLAAGLLSRRARRDSK